MDFAAADWAQSQEEPTQITHWTYDTAANGIGLLASEEMDSGYTRTFTYDSLSRPSSVTEQIGNESFTFSYTYDSFGRPRDTVYPNGILTLRNEYSGLGYLTRVRSPGSGGTVYWEADEIDGTGSLSQFTLGNGLVTRVTRDLRLGFVERIRVGTTSSNANRQHLEMGWNLSGHLLSRQDHRRHLREEMSYDALQRLSTVTRTTEVGQGGETTHKECGRGQSNFSCFWFAFLRVAV